MNRRVTKWHSLRAPVAFTFTLHLKVHDHTKVDFKFPCYGLQMSFEGPSQFHGHCKVAINMVDVSISVIDPNQTPTFEWYVIRCGSKDGYQKDMFKRDWTTCSKYDSHSRPKGQHDWEDLYDHLMNMRNFVKSMNNIFIRALKTMRIVAMTSIWIC